MSDKIPFFINSNIVTSQDDLKTLDSFMNAIGGNTGNSYITYSLLKECFSDAKTFGHIKNIFTYDFANSDKDIDFINNQATHVFLVLQDHIRETSSLPFENIMKFIKNINKPVIIAGLGCNYFTKYNKDFYKTLSSEMVQFLRFLSEHSIEIGVRGCITHEVLSNLGIKNVRVIGCPSYFEQGKDRVLTKCENITYDDILLTTEFSHSKFKDNFQTMQDNLVLKYIDAFAYNNFNHSFNNYETYRLKNKKYYIFSNIQEWQKFVKQFKFTIGHRLHGAIISINSGIPAICGNKDIRATETCSFLGIPHFPNLSQDLDFVNLYKTLNIDKMNNSYNSLYENFEQFLNKNNLQLSKQTGEYNKLLDFPSLELYNKDYNRKLYLYIMKNLKDKLIVSNKMLL